MLNNSVFFDFNLKARLPRSLNVYFGLDSGALSNTISMEQKFLELGTCLWYGLDLYKEMKEIVDNHAHIPDYEESAIRRVAFYLEELRSGGTKQPMFTSTLIDDPVIDGVDVRKLGLKEVVNLFSKELLMRYRGDHLAEYKWNYDEVMQDYVEGRISRDELAERFYKPTDETKIPITEDEVRSMNPWDGDYLKPNWSQLVDEDSEWLLRQDAYYIRKFNEQYKGTDYEYILNVRPEVFNGNPLKAKVVALSLNPGYVHRVNNLLGKMMPPQIAEEIIAFKERQLQLRVKSFMIDSVGRYKGVSVRDAANMYDDWYWYDILNKFRQEAELPDEEEHDEHDIVYDNFSLIQYIGYPSKSFKDLSKNTILPSQRFTKLLVHYIAQNRKDVIFVVSRSEDKWRGLIGEEYWEMRKADKRLVLRRRFKNKKGAEQAIRTQYFNRKGFEGEDAFDRIVSAMKGG